MKLLIKNIILFCVVGLLLGEAIARMFSTTSDIPSRIIDQNDIQKYKPNQTGNWIGGAHGWTINEEGWPGQLPKSKDKLITIIGDSYIENFMNPDSCRQSEVLKRILPSFNYYEASRSGISFIEAMEIASKLDSLQPLQQLIYLHDSDFLESIVQIKRLPDLSQYNSESNEVIPGVIKSPGLKKILYNWKFIYFLYTNYSFGTNNNKNYEPKSTTENQKSLSSKQKEELHKLLSFVKETYNLKNITFVVRPNADLEILTLLNTLDCKVLLLNDDDNKDWSFEYDAHWTCIGHSEAAKQVSSFLSSSADLK